MFWVTAKQNFILPTKSLQEKKTKIRSI